MRTLKIMLVVGVLALAGHFGVAEAQENPDHAANRLLVTSTLTWNQYLALGVELDATQYAARLELLNGIAANLDKIVTNYPESSLAVQLVSTGVAGKLSTAEVAALAGELSEKLPCLTAAETCFDLFTGPTLALAIEAAASIEISYVRDDVTSVIAAAQARAGDIAGARETVKSIEGVALSVWLLAEIAGAQARAGDIAGARETVGTIVWARPQVLALAEIARAQAAAGDIAGARETVKSAREAVKRIADAAGRDLPLAEIAGAQARAGDIAEARETVKSIVEAGTQVQALAEIARAQAAAGDISGARATAETALVMAKSIEAGLDGWSLTFVAGAQAAAGDIAGARETVETIGEAYQANALAYIAGEQAAAGDGAGAMETMTLAIDTAKGIESASRRASALAWIVYWFNLARS